MTPKNLAQEMLRLELETREKQKQHNLAILDRVACAQRNRLTLLREEIYQTHGMFPGDLVVQVRAEREKQIDRVMRGEP